VFSFSSCLNDLDTTPEVEVTLEELLNENPDAIVSLLNKLYASYALSGPDGPGSTDIEGDNVDPGESAFLRGIINLQDFSADAMKNRWGDDGLDQLTTASSWDGNNKFFKYLYSRIYFTIPQCNNLINIIDNVDIDNKEQVLGEVKFLRALAYYYLIDIFGKGVIATEENLGQTTPLPEATRQELFDFTESELLEVLSVLPESNDYGRANKYAASMLLAKLYMNAEVYTGTARYDDAVTYISDVINNGGYDLATDFEMNFTTDNNMSPEIIYPLIADSEYSQSYGNTTYIVNGSLNTSTMGDLAQYGATEGWGGHRSSKAWYGLYGEGISNSTELRDCDDVRAGLFFIGEDPDSGEDLHQFEMTNYKTWEEGYPSIKFTNRSFTGNTVATAFSSTDFPLFRLADTYLMYAECAVRGAAGADMGTALVYVNDIRERSDATTIISGDLSEGFILDERARELNLEGHRRSDLIRFGKFTGSAYLWPWKGNVQNGSSIPEYYNVFPIPQSALEANPNLTQNIGY